MKLYQIIKWGMTAAAAVLLPAMYLVPALAERRGLFSWMLYGVYVLVVLFIKYISDRAKNGDAEMHVFLTVESMPYS